uniref:Cytohesin Ubiquitin Protein Inducing domain-containing protein n=1 Tax=Callorhinchus milii TaxID=7868 RepID=A0A4W3J448_CALMI
MVPKGEEAEVERLEREFAIQSQITEAARRLAADPSVSKKLKKQRKASYLNALKKLQDIENSINEYRVKSGKKPTQRASLIIEGESVLLSLSLSLLSPTPRPHSSLPPSIPPPAHPSPSEWPLAVL